MKVGVVMPVRDAWPFTQAALASLRSMHDLYVVVVDDGSTDETKTGLKAWQSEDKAARWAMYNPPFASLAGKWNIGILRCWEMGCAYVLVANNDVLFHPETIDRLVARMERGDLAIATGHNVAGLFAERGVPPEFIVSGQWALEDPGVEAPCPDFSCFMLSRACWETVGPFDERFEPAYFEDNDYHERLVRLGLAAVNLPAAPYYHYGSVTQNLDATPDPEKHKRFEATRDEFYRKWGFHPHGGAVRTGRLKLMVVGDGDKPTGFARVVHSVLERLAATGDYDIHHLAINYDGRFPFAGPWTMYPAHFSSSGPPDMFGTGRVAEIYDRVNPDAVLMVQDPWHITEYVRTRKGMRGLVSYYPVDSPNLDPLWAIYQARCVESCTYTRFGARETAAAATAGLLQATRDVIETWPRPADPDIRVAHVSYSGPGMWSDPSVQIPLARLAELRDPAAYNVVPHGVDLALFHEVEPAFARRRLELPERGFIVGYPHRNQPRKRQDAMIRAFAKFVKGVRDGRSPRRRRLRRRGNSYPAPAPLSEFIAAPYRVADAWLVLHSPMDSHAGWDLVGIARAYGIGDRLHLTAPTRDGSSYGIADLNLLYNSLDVCANVGGGEGWGLSHIESAACRVAQMVPDWSATGEIWAGAASLIPVAEVRHEPQGVGTMQAVCSTDAAADELLRLYEDRAARGALADAAFALAHRPELSWDAVAAAFDRIIQRAAAVKGVPGRDITIHRRKRVA